MRRTVDGVTLGYEVAGDGPRVLFLHAFPLTRRMWAGQISALVPGCRTLAVDFRGYGESDVPPGPYRLQEMADEAVALARAEGIRRAAVVGLSMGGYAAFRVVEHSPDFVTALVLADTRAEPDTPEARERRLALAQRVRQEGFAAMSDFLKGLLGPTTQRTRPDVSATLQGIIGQPDPGAVAATLTALADRPDSRPLLSRIRVPTLVMVGEEDTLTPSEDARVIASGVSGARLVTLPGVGHLSNLEAPDIFNRELLAFLRETLSETSAS